MTLATGGSACAATSTRSRFLPYACSRASSVVLIPSWLPSSSIRRTRGTRMASLMRVVSRFCGRTCSTGRRLGLKGKSPSWAYSSSFRGRNRKPLHAAARSPRLSDSVEPHASAVAREVRNGSAPASQASQGSKLRREVYETQGLLFAPTAAHGEALVRLAVAVDDHERDLLDLGAADALAYRLRRLAHLDAVAAGDESLRKRARGLEVRLAHRQDPDLDRREPEREGPRVVLDEDADEALERAEERAVDNEHRMLDVVGAHVGEPETLRHLPVQLDRPELPRAAERVGDVQVDLRPVERPL